MITEYQCSTLYFKKTGKGSKCLLLFHGFGQDHTAFLKLTEELTEEYTLYNFDLYFHGQSEWRDDERVLEKKVWKEIMNTFLNEQQIEKFSIVGFSLGGKFALATLEAFPEKIEKLFLIAPDGIKTSFWYSLATYPLLFRRIFRSMIIYPQRFFAVAEVMRSFGLMDMGLLRFAEHQMNTEVKRNRVYNTWIVLRHFKFNMKAMAVLINHYQLSLTLVVGKYDKVIRYRNMTSFLRDVNHYQLEIIEAGHQQLLQMDTFRSIIRILKNNSDGGKQ